MFAAVTAGSARARHAIAASKAAARSSPGLQRMTRAWIDRNRRQRGRADASARSGGRSSGTHGSLARHRVIVAAIFIFADLQDRAAAARLGVHASASTTAPDAGLKFVLPFDRARRLQHSLKEVPLDVPSQVCITRDNTQLQVDGIYFQVTDPMRASYGSSNYIAAITQLAQTLLRSVIGKMELDRTFEERDHINLRSSPRSTRPRRTGASRCCATRSRT